MLELAIIAILVALNGMLAGAELALVSARASRLARLAEDTGGFLIRDTNDIGSAFRRIDEDSRIHYLLTYTPINDSFDGKFRTIDVKVERPGVQVFARKGYRAVRSSSLLRPPAYEAPAVAMLE